MAKSRRWSSASAHYRPTAEIVARLEWRPSRALSFALAVLGALAGAAPIASELPPHVGVPLAICAMAQGARLARRELIRPVRSLVIPGHQAMATIDGEDMHTPEVRWRGSLAFLYWRDAQGRRHGLHGAADNLGPAARRELRLALMARAPVRPTRSMAP